MKTSKTLLGRGARRTIGQRPRGIDIFTDREDHRKRLAVVMAPAATVDPRDFLTQYYGLGGAGKTTLMKQAQKFVEDNTNVTVVALDFDHNAVGTSWSPESSGVSVLKEFLNAASDAGIRMPLSAALLAILEAQQLQPVRYREPEDAVDLIIEASDKGAELVQNIPGVGLGIKLLQWGGGWWKQRSVRRELDELDLWPGSSKNKDYFLTLENKLTAAVCHDLSRYLQDKPERHLRLILDGFEWIQSKKDTYETHYDAQKRMHELFSMLSDLTDDALRERIRVLVFGRHKLEWDALYRWPEWCNRWNLHLLEGLSIENSRELIARQAEWFRKNGEGELADGILRCTEAILDAADETHRGTRLIIPFWIDLAVDMVVECQRKGQQPELGTCPDELFRRFTKEVDPALERTLRVLALAEQFDQEMFNWLAERNVIAQTVGGLGEAVGLNRYCFYDMSRAPLNGFHGLFLSALKQKWFSNMDLRQDGRVVVRQLLEYFAKFLADESLMSWEDGAREAMRRGTALLIRQTPGIGLLDFDEWNSLVDERPWTFDGHRNPSLPLLRRQILSVRQKVLGPIHVETLKAELALAAASESKIEAEALLRHVVLIRTEQLGWDSWETNSAVEKLCGFLSECHGSVGKWYESTDLFYRILGFYISHSRIADSLQWFEYLGMRCHHEDDDNSHALLLIARKASSLGVGDPEIINALESLAEIGVYSGDLTKEYFAGACLGYSIAARSRDLGEDSPLTVRAKLRLKDLLEGVVTEDLVSGSILVLGSILRQSVANSLVAANPLRYNLACYECLSGNQNEARRLIADEIAACPEKRSQALADDDLVTIREFIRDLPPPPPTP